MSKFRERGRERKKGREGGTGRARERDRKREREMWVFSKGFFSGRTFTQGLKIIGEKHAVNL